MNTDGNSHYYLHYVVPRDLLVHRRRPTEVFSETAFNESTPHQ